jgi:hypothetical protein
MQAKGIIGKRQLTLASLLVLLCLGCSGQGSAPLTQGEDGGAPPLSDSVKQADETRATDSGSNSDAGGMRLPHDKSLCERLPLPFLTEVLGGEVKPPQFARFFDEQGGRWISQCQWAFAPQYDGSELEVLLEDGELTGISRQNVENSPVVELAGEQFHQTTFVSVGGHWQGDFVQLRVFAGRSEKDADADAELSTQVSRTLMEKLLRS